MEDAAYDKVVAQKEKREKKVVEQTQTLRLFLNESTVLEYSSKRYNMSSMGGNTQFRWNRTVFHRYSVVGKFLLKRINLGSILFYDIFIILLILT